MPGSSFFRLFNGLAALCLLLAALSLGALFTDMDAAFAHMGAHLTERRAAFAAHVAAAALALGIGPAQLLPGLRRARPGLHRWAGRLYALAAVVGGGAGFLLALDAIGGPVAAAGFALLGALWAGTTLQAARCALLGRRAAHRRWALRSFTLACAAVAFRLEVLLLLGAGLDYEAASQIAAWGCWAPFLAIVEARFAFSASGAGLRSALEPPA